MRRFFSFRKGSLYRRLAIPLLTFVLAASLGLAVWISWMYRRESLRRFEGMAVTNAGFMDQLPFPRSAEMARRLSSILGVEVGFFVPDAGLARSSGDDWPEDVGVVLSGAVGPEAATIEAGGYDVAMAPLAGSRHYLVLVRREEGGLAGMGGWVLAPAVIVTGFCGVLVFLLAHQIVRPLALLTGWLPNLKHGGELAERVPEAVSRRTDEIGQLARSLEHTHRRLVEEQERRQQSERLATLGRIATSLAHEIRNPAAAIRMHADLLDRAAVHERPDSIALIGEEVDRINDLVNQWLFVARAAPPEKRRHDLAGMVRQVVRRLQPALDHAGVRLATRLEGSVEIDCDRLRIEQVIRNLLVNAMEAQPGGGEIAIEAASRSGRVELLVSDSGGGFSDEALRRFGEPFFSEREGGMGIGLTLAREVVEAHGGAITASNPAAGGAMVRISLPATSNSHPS